MKRKVYMVQYLSEQATCKFVSLHDLHSLTRCDTSRVHFGSIARL
jgi:hypothetical protein